MPLSLDHIVIAVADLDSAYSDFGKLGFTVLRGGEHANGITHNVLVIFQDGAYLELIAWKRPDPDNRWSDVFHRAGAGFVDYALLPDDIASVVAGAQARGLDIEDPVFGGRNRPDGERLEWRTARSPGSDVPFLCGDVTPRGLRVQEGEVRRHPNGVSGVAELVVAVRDLDASLHRNAALLPDVIPESGQASVSGSPARTAAFTLGNNTRVTLASPIGSGALADHISARGEGPFSVALRGEQSRELDAALTHGARFTIVP